MKYVSTTEIGKKWNISTGRIGTLCAEGRIPNVQRAGNMWLILEEAKKPVDARIRSRKYRKQPND